MKIIHIVHGKANPDGHNGISRVVYHMNKEEKLLGIDSEVWGLTDDARTHYTHVRDEHVTVECFPRVRLPFGQHELIERLRAEKEQIGLVHFHMIWFYDKNIIAKALKKIGLPFIITTHGTYSKPHAWTGKRWFARILFERAYLNMAEEIHVITDNERTELARYGYRGQTFSAPNGIALDEVSASRKSNFFATSARPQTARILWIGVKRDDKNLDSLIRAMALLPQDMRDTITLSLIGPDHKGTEAACMALAKQQGVEDCIEFLDAVYGPRKYDAIESADLFILPSFNEVFALAMLDAMACAKPCMTSHGCGYAPFAEDDFFIGFEPTPEGIKDAILQMLARKEDWVQMGQNARKVIERDLNWAAITKTMVENYARIAAA